MLVVVLPSLLLLIVVGIVTSAYLIYKPDACTSLEDKVKIQRPNGRRRTPSRRH